MSKNFYISDLHFSHLNAISFDNRPWQTVEEMDEAIVNIWNSRVTDNDDVWILGDISWTNPYNTRVLMARLKGKKHWIIGNHDYKIAKNEELIRQFVDVHEGYHKHYDNGKTVILSHYPIFMYDGVRKQNVHLYGHVHINEVDRNFIEKWKREYEEALNIKMPMYNVGIMVDYMKWGPKTLDQILEANQ